MRILFEGRSPGTAIEVGVGCLKLLIKFGDQDGPRCIMHDGGMSSRTDVGT